MANDSALKVKIFEADGVRTLPFERASVTIGSAGHCDVHLKSHELSPEHARAWCEGGRIWVQDLGGAAGSFLNDIRLSPFKPMLMRERDVLRLGECSTTFGFEPGSRKSDQAAAGPSTVAPVALEPTSDTKAKESEILSRELAELRLRLQMVEMAHPEPADAPTALAEARENIVQLEQENSKLRRQLDNQLQDLKLKNLKELKDQEAALEQKFLLWRRNALSEIKWWSQALFDRKVKPVLDAETRRDRLPAWEGELEQAFCKVLLNENEAENRMLEESREILKAARAGKGRLAWTEIGLGAAVVVLALMLVSMVFFRPRSVAARALASVPCQTTSH